MKTATHKTKLDVVMPILLGVAAIAYLSQIIVFLGGI